MTLRESEECFRRVFEEGPLGLALVGKDYRFIKVNAALCRMVGYSEASLLQMSFADVTYPDDLPADVELAERLFRAEIPFFTMQKRYVKKTGEIIWVKLTACCVHNKEGKPLYGLGMIEDITEIRHSQEVKDRLVADLATSRDEIRALAASLMRAQEDERRRVSRELHDHVCNQLASLASEIGNLAAGRLSPVTVQARLKEIEAQVVRTSHDTHQIARQMHTALLDDLGLVTSLKELCRQFPEHYSNSALDFQDSGVPTSISSEVASCLYRVAQESLQNIAKHSRANRVSVRLLWGEQSVVLTIQDDGAGFDPNSVKGGGGLGLISMEERARLVKGRLTITSKPGHGTEITLGISV